MAKRNRKPQHKPCVCWLKTTGTAHTTHCGCDNDPPWPPEACFRTCTTNKSASEGATVWPQPCLTCGRRLASWHAPLHHLERDHGVPSDS